MRRRPSDPMDPETVKAVQERIRALSAEEWKAELQWRPDGVEEEWTLADSAVPHPVPAMYARTVPRPLGPAVRPVLTRERVHVLEPLPEKWAEGCELVIPPRESPEAAEAVDHWLEDLNALGDPFEEPGEWERFQANLAEADRLAKECVRRHMDLP